MARWERWRVGEFDLLVDLVEREGLNPRPESVQHLSNELRRLGREWSRRAEEPSFRSPGSIESQLYKISLLARGDLRAEERVPPAMRVAWEQRGGERPTARPLLAEPRRRPRKPPGHYKADRAALVDFLEQLRVVLSQLADGGERLLPKGAQIAEFRSAWTEIEADGLFELAIERLRSREVEPALTDVGLVGSGLKPKLSGFRRTHGRLTKSLTWLAVKPVLKWANVILGSLGKALPFLDPIKEFKESWEAAAEEGYEGKA
jgi:hypothetical protein